MNKTIEELKMLANKVGLSIHNIVFRKAGVAIQYFDFVRHSSNWKDDLIIYKFYKDIDDMLENEKQRMLTFPAREEKTLKENSCLKS